jgi:hypothetical protein
MTKKTKVTAISEEVHDFLSENGKKGGLTTRRLIELGKQAAEENGENVKQEVMNELQRDRKKSA